MEKARVLKAIEEVKKQDKRKFSQSYDLIINLKHLDVKTNPLDLFVTLPFSKGKSVKIAAFVDPQLADQATKHCQFVIKETDFPKYAADKKLTKKLAEEYDYFIAQSTLMAKIAAAFGKVLGTKGKMPNPKLGCVVPPNNNLEPLVKKLNTTVRLSAKKGTNVQCVVGKETQSDNEVAENILTVYHMIIKSVPNETQNIKNVIVKSTMGKPIKI